MQFIKIELLKNGKELIINKNHIISVTLKEYENNNKNIYVFKTTDEILEGQLLGESGKNIYSARGLHKVLRFLNKTTTRGQKND